MNFFTASKATGTLKTAAGLDQTVRLERLRGAALSSGCVPPNRASRLALSRSIKAFKLSLKKQKSQHKGWLGCLSSEMVGGEGFEPPTPAV